jgi:hypothetical protein
VTARRLKAPKDDFPQPWEIGPISEERWNKHRDRMLAFAGPRRRPSEWWIYEKQREEHPTSATSTSRYTKWAS